MIRTTIPKNPMPKSLSKPCKVRQPSCKPIPKSTKVYILLYLCNCLELSTTNARITTREAASETYSALLNNFTFESQSLWSVRVSAPSDLPRLGDEFPVWVFWLAVCSLAAPVVPAGLIWKLGVGHLEIGDRILQALVTSLAGCTHCAGT